MQNQTDPKTQPEQQAKFKTKRYIGSKILDTIHLFSVAYIVG